MKLCESARSLWLQVTETQLKVIQAKRGIYW